MVRGLHHFSSTPGQKIPQVQQQNKRCVTSKEFNVSFIKYQTVSMILNHIYNTKNVLGHTIERRKSGPWQPLVSSSSDNNAGDQGTTTTSFGKIDELDTGNNSPCGDGMYFQSKSNLLIIKILFIESIL